MTIHDSNHESTAEAQGGAARSDAAPHERAKRMEGTL
jgi:hypothetical protein